MHKKEKIQYIIKGLVLLLIVLGTLNYWYRVRPVQIRIICRAKQLKNRKIQEQNKEALIKLSMIEREKHQKEFAKLSQIEREKPKNMYLIEKWDNNNIEEYEKQLEENNKKQLEEDYKNCLNSGGK